MTAEELSRFVNKQVKAKFADPDHAGAMHEYIGFLRPGDSDDGGYYIIETAGPEEEVLVPIEALRSIERTEADDQHVTAWFPLGRVLRKRIMS